MNVKNILILIFVEISQANSISTRIFFKISIALFVSMKCRKQPAIIMIHFNKMMMMMIRSREDE